VYLCSSGDLALFNPKWFGWHVVADTIRTANKRYTCAQVESIEWFYLANARRIDSAHALEQDINAQPISNKTILYELNNTR